ncbi:MAG: GGDEF domain-containing protein [Gallionellaceae bacterium]|nr:GGDEF domain-containing protein [Gallionellaceae bacterium]
MVNLSDIYRLDRLTAEFLFPETERQFRDNIKEGWIQDTRQAIFVSALFYLMFAITDWVVMADQPDYWLVLLNRLVVCIVGLSAALMARPWWRKLVNGLIPSVVVVFALAAFVWKIMLVPVDYGVHGMGMMAMLLGVYVFIPNRYLYALVASVSASVAFLLVTLVHFNLLLGQLMTLMAMLLVTNILGAMVAWRSSIVMRKTFCDHAVLRAANERLESEAEVRRRLEEVLRQRADQDETTGVANRTTLFEAASQLFIDAEVKQQPLSLLLLDVDYFRQLNSTYGHMRGDDVLKALVSVCAAVLGRPHFLARLGGEVFVVLLPDTRLAEATGVAERVRAECQRMPVAIAEVAIHFTVSVGVAQRHSAEPLNVLLRRADEAVSAAKYNGRNRVETAS